MHLLLLPVSSHTICPLGCTLHQNASSFLLSNGTTPCTNTVSILCTFPLTNRGRRSIASVRSQQTSLETGDSLLIRFMAAAHCTRTVPDLYCCPRNIGSTRTPWMSSPVPVAPSVCCTPFAYAFGHFMLSFPCYLACLPHTICPLACTLHQNGSRFFLS